MVATQSLCRLPAGHADIDLLAEYFSLVQHPVAIFTLYPRIALVSSNVALSDQLKQEIIAAVTRIAYTTITSFETEAMAVGNGTEDQYRWWNVRRVRQATVLIVEGILGSGGLRDTPASYQSSLQSTSSSNDHALPSIPSAIPPHLEKSTLLLPTPDRPQPYPKGQKPDLTEHTMAVLQHNALFLAHPWEQTPLGGIHTWSTQLCGVIQTMMASPFPVIMSYGPEYVILYNEAYSAVIGRKHPTILGMRYRDAWHEIWDVLEPSFEAGYQGRVLSVEAQEMFLLRGERLEETYFSYSLTPLRDSNNNLCGLYIPNFDNTTQIITERRIRSLHEISQHMNRSLSSESMVKEALKGMQASNSRDMHFALCYLAESTDEVDWIRRGDDGVSVEPSEDGFTIDGGSATLPPPVNLEIAPSSHGQSSSMLFRLAGSYGVGMDGDDGDIPTSVISGPEKEDIEFTETEDSIAWYVRQARELDEAIYIPDLRQLSFSKRLNGNPFGDELGAAIVLPIRSSSEDKLHGILILGLNSRLPWNEAYSNYIYLVRGLMATGLATIKLHAEEMSRARYMATLNRQKSEQLQQLLKLKSNQLKTSELKFSSAFAACPAAIWIADPEGKMMNVNQAFLHMSGMTGDAGLDNWIDRIHPDDKGLAERVYREYRYKRMDWEFRFLPSAEDMEAGVTEKWIEASGGPVFDETGMVVMLSGTLLDITIRRSHLLNQTKRADDALELKRLQDHFIDMLSHELRNPLSAICLSTDGVIERLQSLEQRAAIEHAAELQDIVRDAGVVGLCTMHMRRLVDDVLALSKLDNNILVVTPTRCQPEEFCHEVLRMVGTEFLASGISASFRVKQGYRDLGVDYVEVDPSRITQILINLLTNAIKFTSAANHREIALTLDASVTTKDLPGSPTGTSSNQPVSLPGSESVYLIFEVRDTGIGMREEEIERLFQRFQQGSNNTHVNFGGSGLGLFICRRILHLLGGEISVRSQLGVGSTFAFYLPVPVLRSDALEPPHNMIPQAITSRQDSTAAKPTLDISAKERTSTENGRRSFSVLLVEDNEISRKLLKKQLLRAGCEVATANDGVEAIEYMLASSAAGIDQVSGPVVDVILMDIEMPRKGGVEASRDIRQMEAEGRLRHRTPIIAVSANVREGQIETMIAAGMDATVSKPFKIQELLRQIEALT